MLVALIFLFMGKIPEKPEEYPDFNNKSILLDKEFLDKSLS